MSNKIFIFLLNVVLLEYYFGCASPATYEVTKENEKSKNDLLKADTKTKQNIQQYDYKDTQEDDYKEDDNKKEDDYKCVPESSSCICKCTKNKVYNCDECVVLSESNTGTCIPGEIIQFFCPNCPCDEDGTHVCEKCYQKRINTKEKISNNLEDNTIYRKKREADSFYDYLYNKDPVPLSTEQIRELKRQAYLQRRQDVIDKRREKQELAEQQAELARQQAEMRKELEYQRRLDEEQRALDAQQDYIGDYAYEDTNYQDQDEYFTKKTTDQKIRF